ncbi:MAG: GNAT family N-acetyltransferase [Acidimicrobiales bacterium]
MSDDPHLVELVDVQVVRPLRRAVLRPQFPAEQSEYPADDDPRSAHVAIRLPGHLEAHSNGPGAGVVAVGTVLSGPPPWEPQRADGWRVRGMATRPDARGRGLGGLILRALLDHVAAHGGGLVWCNARVPALGLYGRAGFVARGEVFDMPGIGPHMCMWRTVARRLSPSDVGPPPPVPT